jgi:hypothetical protein
MYLNVSLVLSNTLAYLDFKSGDIFTKIIINFLENSDELLTNFLRTSYELLTNFLWTSYNQYFGWGALSVK